MFIGSFGRFTEVKDGFEDEIRFDDFVVLSSRHFNELVKSIFPALILFVGSIYMMASFFCCFTAAGGTTNTLWTLDKNNRRCILMVYVAENQYLSTGGNDKFP